MAWEVWRAFDQNLIAADYELPTFQFRWWLFDWVRPVPGRWIYVAFAILGFAGLAVAIGLFYRWQRSSCCSESAYWFLLEKAAYLNHRYLASSSRCCSSSCRPLLHIRSTRSAVAGWSEATPCEMEGPRWFPRGPCGSSGSRSPCRTSSPASRS